MTPGVGVGRDGGSSGDSIRKMLKFLCESFLCDGQGADRQAILFGTGYI